AAADALVSIGSRAVPSFIEKLDSTDLEARRNAVEALGKIGDPRAVDPLRERLCQGRHFVNALEMLDWNPEKTRETIIQNLAHGRSEVGEAKDPAAIETLIEAFNSDDAYIRTAASTVLTRSGSDAVRKLIEALKDKRILVRSRAASTLAAIGDAKAVSPLIASLKA